MTNISSPMQAWWHEYLAAAKADEFRWIRQRFADDPTPPGDIGRTVANRTLEVFALVLAFARMDRGSGPEATERVQRFFLKQRYGGPPEEAGARFRVSLLGAGPPVDFFLEDVGEVDFQDLYEAVCCVEVRFRNLGGPFDEAFAAALVEEVTADLTYDDDLLVETELIEEHTLSVFISEA